MLYQFLIANRTELIARCRAKVALRPANESGGDELQHGISLFLDQLSKTLEVEQGEHPAQSTRVSGSSGGGNTAISEIGEGATQHGGELLRHGFSIEQVVHDYGDLCQAVTEVAIERGEPITVDEYHTFNRCTDNAIAEAVTEFSYQRDSAVANRHVQDLNQQMGMLAHELRNLLTTAMIAQSLIKSGDVATHGATSAVLDRSLIGMRSLIDRSLAEARMSAETEVKHELFSLSEFVNEVKLSANLEAQTRGCTLSVSEADAGLWIDGDRDLLFSALNNLLQNAFKFSPPKSEVRLGAYASSARILIDVEDFGAGLAPGQVETMFLPWTQAGADRSGAGLGLSIAKRSIEANAGTIRVRSKSTPESGCVFTMDLPRRTAPEAVPN